MIDLPKYVKQAKTLRTFLKRLGDYCYAHADNDISVVRHFLQVYIDISRVRGVDLKNIMRDFADVKYASREGTFEAFYGMQKKFTSPEHRNYMEQLFYAYMQDGFPRNIEIHFNNKIQVVAFHAVKSLFFMDPRGTYRSVEAKFMFDFASRALVEYGGKITDDDLLLLKASVVMETDIWFIRGPQ